MNKEQLRSELIKYEDFKKFTDTKDKIPEQIIDEYLSQQPESEDECPACGESDNLHYNYDYTKEDKPVEDVICNECGEIFKLKQY